MLSDTDFVSVPKDFHLSGRYLYFYTLNIITVGIFLKVLWFSCQDCMKLSLTTLIVDFFV